MNHSKLKKLFIIILIAISFTTSCRQAGIVNNTSHLRVGYIPIVDCLPLYVAKEKGFFEKRGIETELTPLQGGPVIIEALVSKNIDIGYSNIVSTILANSKGLPIVGITGGPIESKNRQAHALLVLTGSSIKTPKDLAGKTIAMNALRNIEYVILMQYLEENGVDTNSVKTIEAPVPQLEGLLKTGSADAIMQVEPYVTLATNNGMARILSHPYTEVRERNVVASYNARQDWLDNNTETRRKFAEALAEANDFISKNDVEARQILVKYTKIPDEIVGKVVLPESLDKFEDADVQFWINALLKQKMIEKPISSQNIIKQF